MRTLGALLFPDFELLDLFGPLEMFGNMGGAVSIVTVGHGAGLVRSAQGPRIQADVAFDACPPLDLVLVPGGMGSAALADDPTTVEWLRTRSVAADTVMTVCTGTQILAATGLLDGRRATTNKMLFRPLTARYPRVTWVAEARWVEDGPFVTSSGVSAGIDMALAVIARLAGPETSEALALGTEYEWHRDPAWDPFAQAHGLV